MQTLPQSSQNPADSGAEESASLTAFRRGRLLVWIVVAGSAAFWLQDVLRKLPWLSSHGETSISGSGIVVGLLCWSAVRGGLIGGGFFIVVYGSLFLQCLAGRVNELGEWLSSVGSSFYFHVGFTGPGQDFDAVLSYNAAAAWVAFSLWVLLGSKSARLYRKVRRRQIAAREANAFEWPPAHRS